jgi:hypothetical protein
MRRVLNVTALVAAAVVALGSTVAKADLADKPLPAGAPRAATQLPAHLACMQALEGTLKLQPAVAQAIGHDDLAALTRLYEDVDVRLRAARIDMDRAFLKGAWQSPALRKQAAELMGEMDGVQMLNFIGLAFLKGYDNPTNKVSSSVKDANEKMFMQLGQLLDALTAFNSTAGAASSSPGP